MVNPGKYLKSICTNRRDDPAMLMIVNPVLGLVLEHTPGRNLIQLQTDKLDMIFASETAIERIAEDNDNG